MELAFLGDIALFGCNTTGSDYKKKFAPVKDILSRYEYVIGNLETPLTDTNKPVGGKSAYLKSSPSNVEILQYLGVTHLSLANNHTFDYRRKGLDDTVKSLDANGIEWYGAYSKSVPIDDGETRVMLHGFCCYSSNGKGLSEDGNGVNVLNPMKIEQDIENDICKGYYPVLSCHWGQEHVHYANYDHVRLFRTLSDKYDILIHGHHPHVIQGIEKIKNSLCAYSLGNFCFDDVYTKKSDKPLIKLSDDNKQSFILSVEIIGNEIKAFEQIPFTFTDDEYKTDDGCTKGKIDEWNLFLNTDRFEYNQKRREDLNRYLNERKTLRNIKWYIKRLNFESVGIILVNKENQARYNELVLKYINKSTSVTERQDKILICGNFSMAEMNAAGKRVYGVGCVYRELGYEVVLAGVDKKRTGSICESRRQIKGFTNFAFRAAVSGRGWLRVWENYNELISVINEIGIDGLKCIYFYGSPVVAVWIKKVIAFARKNKIRTVFDCVDWIEKTGGGKLRNIIKYIDTNYMKRIVAKKTDGIVTISSWLRDYYFKSSGNVIIIP
ncbi:MAG: CapA family protein, partial [Petrimonas sp.]|nr:CapA family protein [Petrimonas sp.]